MKELFRCIHGSFLYGCNTPASDRDFKGIFLPELKEIILGTAPKSIRDNTKEDSSRKNSVDDIDCELYSLRYFIDMACAGETITIDTLHANKESILVSSPEWEFIQANRSKFYSKKMSSFIGYARTQAGRYGLRGSRMGSLEKLVNFLDPFVNNFKVKTKLEEFKDLLPTDEFLYFEPDPTKEGRYFYNVLGSQFQDKCPATIFFNAIMEKWATYGERARLAKENNGIDWKAIHHALRACVQIEEILVTGDLQYPLKDARFLTEVKLGQHDFMSVVQPKLEWYVDHVTDLLDKSSLPKVVDKDFWYNWYYSVVMEHSKC